MVERVEAKGGFKANQCLLRLAARGQKATFKNQNFRVVGIEIERAPDMLLRHVVVAAVEIDRRYYSVAAAFLRIEFERVPSLCERNVENFLWRSGVAMHHHRNVGSVRVRDGIPGIEGNSLLEHFKGQLVGAIRVAAKVSQATQQAIVGS